MLIGWAFFMIRNLLLAMLSSWVKILSHGTLRSSKLLPVCLLKQNIVPLDLPLSNWLGYKCFYVILVFIMHIHRISSVKTLVLLICRLTQYSYARTKYFEVDFHFVRDRVQNELQVKFICSKDQLADILTKSLSIARHQTLTFQLTIRSFFQNARITGMW